MLLRLMAVLCLATSVGFAQTPEAERPRVLSRPDCTTCRWKTGPATDVLGTMAAFVLEDSLPVNLAALDDSSLVRYDVLTLRPLRWLASWTEQTPRSQRFGASNRRNTVYSISPREATITERTVSIRTP
jgi:hypothetical protein